MAQNGLGHKLFQLSKEINKISVYFSEMLKMLDQNHPNPGQNSLREITKKKKIEIL